MFSGYELFSYISACRSTSRKMFKMLKLRKDRDENVAPHSIHTSSNLINVLLQCTFPFLKSTANLKSTSDVP